MAGRNYLEVCIHKPVTSIHWVSVEIPFRHLAHKSKVKWKEYWQFLDTLCDLSEPDGLQVLEDYLGKPSVRCTPGDEVASEVDELGGLLESKLMLTPKSNTTRDYEDGEFLAGLRL